jgi:threonine dehydrogenase-like Zn-dependent dehydrogenase
MVRPLVDAAQIQEGETILITGVSGAVERAASQIAHWRKANVIGVDRSERPNKADALVNVASNDLLSEVKALTNGKGVDLVLDAVGGPGGCPARCAKDAIGTSPLFERISGLSGGRFSDRLLCVASLVAARLATASYVLAI